MKKLLLSAVLTLSLNAPDGKTRLYGFISYPKDRTKKYPARFEVPSAGAVGQPHGPPDPVWYGTQEWLLGCSGWRETFGPQLGYVHGAASLSD